jgi:hypothetical protein
VVPRLVVGCNRVHSIQVTVVAIVRLCRPLPTWPVATPTSNSSSSSSHQRPSNLPNNTGVVLARLQEAVVGALV